MGAIFTVPVTPPGAGYSSGEATGRGDVAFYYNGADYAFLMQSANPFIGGPQGDGKVHAMVSLDGQVTWAELDAANAPAISGYATGILGLSAEYTLCRDGSHLYLIAQNFAHRAGPDPSNYSLGVQVWTFDLSAATWSVPNTLSAPLPSFVHTTDVPIVTIDETSLFKVVRLSAGNMTLVYNGAQETIGSFSYARVYTVSFDGSTFGLPVEIPGQAGASTSYSFAEATFDSAGYLHVLLQDTTISPGNIYSVSRDPGGAWGALILFESDYAHGDVWPDNISNFVDLGGVLYVADVHGAGGVNGVGVLQLYWATAGTTNLSWQTAQISDQVSSISVTNYIGKIADLHLVGTTLVAAWGYDDNDSSATSLNARYYYSTADTSDPSTWAPFTLLADGTGGSAYGFGQIFGYLRPGGIGYTGMTENDSTSTPHLERYTENGAATFFPISPAPAPAFTPLMGFGGGGGAGRGGLGFRCCSDGHEFQAARMLDLVRKAEQRKSAWPYLHEFPPNNSIPVHVIASIPSPVVNVVTPILSYIVPEGFRLYLEGILQDFQGATINPLDALWTVDKDAQIANVQSAPVNGLFHTPVPLGSVLWAEKWPFPRAYEFAPLTILRSTVLNKNLGVGLPNVFVSGFFGYLIPDLPK